MGVAEKAARGANQQATLQPVNNGTMHESRLVQSRQASKWLLVRWLFLLAVSGWASKRKQQKGTGLPLVLRQITKRNDALCSLLSAILLRKIRRAMFSGTRARMKSLVGSTRPTFTMRRRHVIESMTNAFDGSKILVEWQLPDSYASDSMIENVLTEPINHPVVLIVPDLGDGTDSDYVQRMMRACTDRGWIAAAIDNTGSFRAFTSQNRWEDHRGDTNNVRTVISTLSRRMQEDQPLFLVGYSLGSNVALKYLGEEGVATSTPTNLVGAVSVNDPMNGGEKSHEVRLGDSSDDVNTRMTRSSSCNHIALVEIPTMVICSSGDPAASQNAGGLQRCLSNPNVIVVKENSGEHTDWNFVHRFCRSKSERAFATWVDVAATKFFDAVIREKRFREPTAETTIDEVEQRASMSTANTTSMTIEAYMPVTKIRSRL